MRLLILFLFVSVACGCALPRFEEPSSSVPQKELVAVSAAREGMGYYRAGRLPEAELKFRQVLWLYPGTENILYNLALTLARQSAFSEAQSIYAGLIKRSPDSIALLSAVGETYFLAGDYKLAREKLKQAFSLAEKKEQRGEQARLARSLVALNFSAGDEEEALCYSYLAAGLSGGNDDLLKHSRVLVALHLYRQAQEVLSDLTKKAEKRADAQSLYQLALADYAVGRFSDVVDRSELALEASAREVGMLVEFKQIQMLAERRLGAVPGNSAGSGRNYTSEEQQELRGLSGQMLSSPARLLFLPRNMLEDLKREG